MGITTVSTATCDKCLEIIDCRTNSSFPNTSNSGRLNLNICRPDGTGFDANAIFCPACTESVLDILESHVDLQVDKRQAFQQQGLGLLGERTHQQQMQYAGIATTTATGVTYAE